MKIRILAVGKIKEQFTKQWIAEFEKRLTKYCALETVEIKESTPLKEGESLLKLLKDDYAIAFDVNGSFATSTEFASLIKQHMLDHNIAIVIGGPDGLSMPVLLRANQKISLSRMTFTHQLARLLVMEQVYRAFTIMKGEKYHK